MKKVLLVFAFASLILSSCSTYTCPTYTKTNKPVYKEQIQDKNV